MAYFIKLMALFSFSFTFCAIRFSKNKMKKSFVIALLLLSSSVFAEDSFLKNKTVVGCENKEGYPPFIFKNSVSGKLEGYSVDLLNLVFKDSGAKMKYRLLPWKRCMAYMGRGIAVDIVLAAASTEERRKKYIFSDAFSKVHLAFFYDHQRYPIGLGIEKPSDFDSIGTVCGMRGFVYGNYGLSKEVSQIAGSFQQLVSMVVGARCDALLARYEVFKSLPMVSPDFKYHYRMKGGIIPWRKDEPIKFYFLAKKNSAYHKQLIGYINKKMKRIEKSGRFKEIKEKYGFIAD